MKQLRITLPILLFITSLTACDTPQVSTLATLAAWPTQTTQVIPVTATVDLPATEPPLPEIAQTALPVTPMTTITVIVTTPAVTPDPTQADPQGIPEPGAPCNLAAPGDPIDVTIADDTPLIPGQEFTKVWRLRNSGECTWTGGYQLVWFSSETFGASPAQALPRAVVPGETVDLAVDMQAPEQPGAYQSNWKLRSPEGELFGIGPNGESPVWVRIVVIEPTAPPSSPTGTVTPTPLILITGTASLEINDTLDLDENLVNPPAGVDVAYIYPGVLAPQFGGELGQFIPIQPDLTSCRTANLSATELVKVENVPVGSYLCYRTQQGLPGWIKLLDRNAANGTLTLEMLTWSVP